MTKSDQEITIENLDHLGIIAGIIDEIGLVEKVNELLGEDRREKVSCGLVVKAIILNAMGFTTRPMYLFPQFFQDKAVEHLLGKDIKASELNDDKLGRVMDKMYRHGLTGLFSSIALSVIKKYQIVPKYSHLDSTSFHLHGEYNNRPNREPEQEVITEHPIAITHGYSRDHRPDLKQCILDLIVSGDGEIPLFLRVGSGNESDKAMFGKILVEYAKQIDFESTMVADSAFYTANNLKMMENIKWISRVPLSIKAAKNLVREIEEKELIASTNQGYSYWEKRISYGGVEQRWLLVESAERKKSDRHKILKKIETERREITKKFANISRQEFDLEATATSQIIALESKLKYHLLVDKQIVTSVRSDKEIYTISAIIEENTELINQENNQAGRFILATNSLESSPLSCDDILTEYKNQQGCEIRRFIVIYSWRSLDGN
jgi:transposase